MSIIQDKLGNEFLRNGAMEPNFAPGMLMFSHLPPVTSFTRMAAAQSALHELAPPEVVLKKERDSPDCGASDYGHAAIKQEKLTELDYRLPLYPGCSAKGADLLMEASLGNHHHHHHHHHHHQQQQNLLAHDLSLGNLSQRLVKEPSGRRGRRSNGDGQEGKPRRKRGDSSKSMMLDGELGSLSPGSKPHICEHCSAAFRSSYHLRRHVLIHTGERPFRCSQCNMSFIQKYLLQRHEKIHSGESWDEWDNYSDYDRDTMERHKRTHSGEKPYKCDTCQQYFSRTDRLLKHKRTCGEAIKKGLDPGALDQGLGDMGQGGYGLTQGNAGTSGRRKGKPKGEGGERKRRKGAGGEAGPGPGAGAGDPGLQGYDASGSGLHGRAPKLLFKKVNRKGPDKDPAHKVGPLGGMDGLALLQGPEAKQAPPSSNYDDAMQFLKKRRYLHAAANSADYEVGVAHLSQQPTVIQGAVGGALDGDHAPLGLLDSSPMGGGGGADPKHDKSGIPDEVLQSLLDHYSQKAEGPHDVPFDLGGDQHVELHPAAQQAPEGGDEEDKVGEKAVIMHEYSRFLLQALERTSHGGGFLPAPSGPFAGPASSAASPPLFSDKHVYAATPLECGFGHALASAPPPGPLPKPHFGMLLAGPSSSSSSSSSQPGFHLGGLDPAHQQLTPSQELTEQLEKQPSPGAFQIPPPDLGGHKDAPPKGSSAYQLPAQDLAPIDPSKGVDLRPPYQIENFAQAFGSQFKAGGRVPLGYSPDSGAEVDHRIRTPVPEFSGYTSLLADVNEPVSSRSKTPTSQSYR
ncbi:zinc finger protein 281-like [Anguilla rostrata]|uniref:zinc finger protein 281-like n=1 Tax=Anguilla rostrata TaxID=7938 RepID=UPI0030CF5B70